MSSGRPDHPAILSDPGDTPSQSSGALAQAGISVPHYRGRNLEFRERTGVTLARLQSLAPANELSAGFDACSLALPTSINACSGQDPAVVCLAPGDWLLLSEFLDFGRLTEQLTPAIDSDITGLMDLSSAHAVVRLAGRAAPWLLQKLCGLDFGFILSADRHFARTRLEQAAVMLHYHQPGSGTGVHVFDVLFDRSLARYLWQLLLMSAPHAEQLYSRHGIPA